MLQRKYDRLKIYLKNTKMSFQSKNWIYGFISVLKLILVLVEAQQDLKWCLLAVVRIFGNFMLRM